MNLTALSRWQRGRILLATALCCLMCGCGKGSIFVENAYSDETQCEDSENITASAVENDASDNESQGSVCVYICGYVNEPGVYELSATDRICDAVEAAGGFAENAAESYWNQAELLYDGEMIYIPSVEEAKERGEADASDTSSAGTVIGETDSQGRININTASAATLTQLSGIGETRAKSIVEYRDENGAFSSTEDIMNVSGIGESLYSKIKDDITVN